MYKEATEFASMREKSELLWEKEIKIRNHVDTMLQTKQCYSKSIFLFFHKMGFQSCLKLPMFYFLVSLVARDAQRQFCSIRVSANLLEISRKLCY